jgi:soluble lytic murein transglycosylase
MAAYPVDGVPEFDGLGEPMERAIVHAIARQESAFDPTAVSHAGARGLMQMMPATARETARRAGLPFDWHKLGQDPLYAAQMGAAHLNDLLKEWRGSYILTFAAYNAGSPNVKKWITAYGDPRDPQVDAVDWVERIPFSETRNYVQRVMENLQVYRERLNQRTAYLIDYDLKRGGRQE